MPVTVPPVPTPDDEHVELVADLLPDLGARALVVRLRVARVGVLVGVEGARRLLARGARETE